MEYIYPVFTSMLRINISLIFLYFFFEFCIIFVLLNSYGYLYIKIENRKFLFLILAGKNRCNELIRLFNLPYSFIGSFLKTFVVLESFLVVFYPDIIYIRSLNKILMTGPKFGILTENATLLMSLSSSHKVSTIIAVINNTSFSMLTMYTILEPF